MNKNSKFIKMLLIIMSVVFIISGCTPNNSDNVNLTNQNEIEKQIENNDNVSEVDSVYEEIPEENEIIVNGELEVHFIDVGQGDSILIKQGDTNMLIDAGERHKGGDVLAYLAKQDVATLDYIIGTHPHSDHIGGLPDVIDALEVKNIILPDKSHTTQIFEKLLNSISNKGLRITTPNVGDEYLLGEAKFTIISPSGNSYSNLNEYSVSIRLEYGENSFVFTGDAEKIAENEMVNSGLDLSADVLKAGHHGSNTSNTDSFLDKVDPDYVVIQVGEGNKYNHPDKDIIEKFERRNIEVYRNDLHGSVVVTSDGKNIKIKSSKDKVITESTSKTSLENTSKPSIPTKSEEINNSKNKPENPENNVATFIGTKTTKKFHKEDCRYVPKEENRAYFDSYQAAIDAGYEGCKVCNPN